MFGSLLPDKLLANRIDSSEAEEEEDSNAGETEEEKETQEQPAAYSENVATASTEVTYFKYKIQCDHH